MLYRVCVKRCQNIYFIGLKTTCLGVLDRGDRDINNETCLKEGEEIEMSATMLHSRAAPSLKLLTIKIVKIYRKQFVCIGRRCTFRHNFSGRHTVVAVQTRTIHITCKVIAVVKSSGTEHVSCFQPH